MLKDIEKIRTLAVKHSKEQLGRMVQMGMLDADEAMLAGFMRDRIAKEDMQPPTTTVLQDTLGLPAVAAAQQPPMPPQPQMPQGAPAPAPEAAPPMMAASGGLAGLPADNVGSYAGGGIVAFAEGGDTYRGKRWEELAPVERKPRWASEYVTNLFEPQGRRIDPITGEEMSLAQFLEKAQRERGGAPASPSQADVRRVDNQLDGRQAPPPAPDAGAPSVEVPSAGSRTTSLPSIKRPDLSTSTFEEKVAQATPKLPTFDITQAKDAKTLGKERREAYAAEGYDPDIFKNMIAGAEEKKGKIASEKDIALGEAIMQAGFKLMGARKGQEFQALSEGAQEGLKNFRDAAKELKARQDKLDERIDTLRVADAQAKRTGAESDIARAEQIQDRVQRDKGLVYQAQSQAATAAVQAATNMTNTDKTVAASMFATETAAATQLKIADINARTQREYTAAFKAQGLQDSQIKNIMNTAAEIYKATLAKNPTADETQAWGSALQQASQGYAVVAPMVGKQVPAGAMPPPAKPDAAAYEAQYKLQPTNQPVK